MRGQWIPQSPDRGAWGWPSCSISHRLADGSSRSHSGLSSSKFRTEWHTGEIFSSLTACSSSASRSSELIFHMLLPEQMYLKHSGFQLCVCVYVLGHKEKDDDICFLYKQKYTESEIKGFLFVRNSVCFLSSALGFRWWHCWGGAEAEGSSDPVQELSFEVAGSTDSLKKYLNTELLIFLFMLS